MYFMQINRPKTSDHVIKISHKSEKKQTKKMSSKSCLKKLTVSYIPSKFHVTKFLNYTVFQMRPFPDIESSSSTVQMSCSSGCVGSSEMSVSSDFDSGSTTMQSTVRETRTEVSVPNVYRHFRPSRLGLIPETTTHADVNGDEKKLTLNNK